MWLTTLAVAFLASHGTMSTESGELAPKMTIEGSRIHLSWLDRAQKSGPRLMTSSFDGRRWSKREVVVQSKALFMNWADVPGVVSSSAGSRLAYWLQKREGGPYAYDIYVAVSNGKRWRNLGILHKDGTASEHGFVSAIALDDGFRVIWLDGRETATKGPMTLRHANVQFDGSIQDLGVLDDRVCDCCGTAAVRNGPSSLRVWYRNRTETEVRDIHAVASRAESSIGDKRNVVVHPDKWMLNGCPVNGPALSTNGTVTVGAWFTAEGGVAKVKAGFVNGEGKVTSPATAFASTVLGRVDVVIDGREGVVVALQDAGKDVGQIVARRFDTEGRMGRPVVLAETGVTRGAGFPQAEVLGGKLVLAYTDTSSSRARIRRKVVPLATVPAVLPTTTANADTVGTLPRPELQLRDLDGNLRTASPEKQVLIHVWATWCRPCLEEMESVLRVARRLKDQGTEVWLVSIDEGDLGRVKELSKSWKADDFVVIDDGTVARALNANAVPATFVFSAAGDLVFSEVGKTTLMSLEQLEQP